MYETLIIEASGCSVNEVSDVETIMREDIFHSTLDWQTKEELRKAAITAYRVYKLITLGGHETY